MSLKSNAETNPPRSEARRLDYVRMEAEFRVAEAQPKMTASLAAETRMDPTLLPWEGRRP